MAWLTEEDDLDVGISEDYDDEAVRILSEMDDDEEGWEDEAFGEARRARKKYRSKYPTGRAGGYPRQAPPRKPIAGLRGGDIQTPAGKARFNFEKPVATKESVENLAKELRKEISLVAEAAKKVDVTVDKNTGVLDKKVAELEAALKKGQQQAQQSMLLPLLLNQPPQLDKIKFAPTPAGSSPQAIVPGAEVSIETTTYKKDDNLFLLFALMSMSGGMGDSSNMMLMLALSGGLGGSSKK